MFITVQRSGLVWLTVVDSSNVNDCAYTFFKSLEVETRLYIFPHHLANALISLHAILEALNNSEDVQFYWSLVSADTVLM